MFLALVRPGLSWGPLARGVAAWGLWGGRFEAKQASPNHLCLCQDKEYMSTAIYTTPWFQRCFIDHVSVPRETSSLRGIPGEAQNPGEGGTGVLGQTVFPWAPGGKAGSAQEEGKPVPTLQSAPGFLEVLLWSLGQSFISRSADVQARPLGPQVAWWGPLQSTQLRAVGPVWRQPVGPQDPKAVGGSYPVLGHSLNTHLVPCSICPSWACCPHRHLSHSH